MSSRDYANRKPSKRRNNRGAKRAPSKRFPLLFLLITLTLVGSFIYLLWSITGSAPEKVESIEKKVTTPIKTKQPANALPQKPKERWTYQQELENKEVEIELPAETQNTRPYQMQCASFRSASQANEMKAVIAFQGLEAQVRKVSGKNGTWYKVVLGPYSTKRLAERDKHKLQKQSINTCQIWHWEGS